MNIPFFIARRYLISKKSHNIINIISVISLVGVMVGSMALVIVLSVFNGLETLVERNFSAVTPDAIISPKQGKFFVDDSLFIGKIAAIDGVAGVTRVLEDIALLTYEDKQFIAHLKGVENNYGFFNHFDTLITEGNFVLQSGAQSRAIVGADVIYRLGLNLASLKPLKAYYPNRYAKNLNDPLTAFNMDVLIPSGVFSIQTESNLSYAIVPIQFMQSLTQYPQNLSVLEIYFKEGASRKKVFNQIKSQVDSRYIIKDRYQQQEVLYKVMQMEKMVVFIILSFVLFLATFNIIGTITMLIIEKKKDVEILKNMGASQSLIQKIFIAEGILINLLGGGLGLVLGALVCFVQQQFGIITMGQTNAEYVVNAYPVEMRFFDFVLIFLVISITGVLSTWIPVKKIINASFRNSN